MDSAKYQSDIIHDIEILCEYVVFLQNGYIFIHDIARCNNSKSTRTFQECKGIPVLEWLGNWRDMNNIDNVWNIIKRLVTKCHVKKEEMWKPVWKPVCEVWYSVTPNVLEERNNSMPGRITDLIKAK